MKSSEQMIRDGYVTAQRKPPKRQPGKTVVHPDTMSDLTEATITRWYIDNIAGIDTNR